MTSAVVLALAVFGACCVESVEALTLVLAAGTRSWRSAFEGAATALVLLAAIVGLVGVPLVPYVPIGVLRVVIGGLLLVLGLSWLRKAILRASGHKALHDEEEIYRSTVARLESIGKPHARRDATSFVISFKGVLLEGTEVVLIVLSLGASSHRLALASTMAGAAVLLVTMVGALVARQLSEVPENSLKLAVGVMLTSFGVFWVGEGAGIAWPGSDLTVVVLIGVFLAVNGGAVLGMRHVKAHEEGPAVSTGIARSR